MRGDVILGAVKRAPRRARAAGQLGRRPSAVLIQGHDSRALWADWRPRGRQQGAREPVGALSLTRTRPATGSATAMISPPNDHFSCGLLINLLYS